MAARATRSASRAASSSDDASRCLLLALSHDELGVIVDGLADPLQPVVAVALSSTCLGLRTPLQAALEVLKQRHARAATLCRRFSMSCAELAVAEKLNWFECGLSANNMATLGMILRTNGLTRLKEIDIGCNGLGDAGVQVLCEGLGHGTAPLLCDLGLGMNNLGRAGAEAFLAALGRGAFPKLMWLFLYDNVGVGDQIVSVLAKPLRKLQLEHLDLDNCGIGDEGVASLFRNLGTDDFKALVWLTLNGNGVSDQGCATLARALKAGAMPKLEELDLAGNPASEAALQAVQDVLIARCAAD